MPYRITPIVTGQIYHIFNRSVARQPIFLNQKDYKRALEVLYFYSFIRQNIPYSSFNRFPKEQKEKFKLALAQGQKQVETLAFSLMPSHFHLLVREFTNEGLTKMVRNFQNSYAKYFNLKFNRNGSLFQTQFKAVRVESDEQLLHLSRYIHLNPLTSFIVKNASDLENYPWTSFPVYLSDQENDFVNKTEVLNYFSSKEDFKKFTLDQVNYQRDLGQIKHLTLDD